MVKMLLRIGLALALLHLMVVGGVLFHPCRATAEGSVDYFGKVQRELVAAGFDGAMIAGLYGRPEIAFDAKGIATFFTYRESRLNYGQFTTWRSIRKAKKYAEKHREALASAENAYGVDRNIITAIILVETKLGTYLGDRFILNTLSTMAALTDPAVREAFWRRIPEKRRISREKYDAKADTKSRWAFAELKAFLRHTAREKIDPCSIRGSFAGAMGIAQFMPSNVLSLGRDGNGDGRVDLFDHADAIASIANYLKHHGWRPGLARKKAYGVILRYNYSKYYANTILDIAEKLSG